MRLTHSRYIQLNARIGVHLCTKDVFEDIKKDIPSTAMVVKPCDNTISIQKIEVLMSALFCNAGRDGRFSTHRGLNITHEV